MDNEEAKATILGGYEPPPTERRGLMGEKAKTEISRRDFVQLAGAGAAAMAGTGLFSPLAAQAQGTAVGIPTNWDIEADIVVIGSGYHSRSEL
jgi:hypothetical protein